jgi:hypothetical protein
VDVLLPLFQNSLPPGLRNLPGHVAQQHGVHPCDHPSLVRAFQSFHRPHATVQIPIHKDLHLPHPFLENVIQQVRRTAQPETEICITGRDSGICAGVQTVDQLLRG